MFPTGLMGLAVIGLAIAMIIRSQRQGPRPKGAFNPERMQIVYRSGSSWGWGGTRREIYQDTETGVQYLLVGTGYSASVTPMLDRDGRPHIGRN